MIENKTSLASAILGGKAISLDFTHSRAPSPTRKLQRYHKFPYQYRFVTWGEIEKAFLDINYGGKCCGNKNILATETERLRCHYIGGIRPSNGDPIICSLANKAAICIAFRTPGL